MAVAGSWLSFAIQAVRLVDGFCEGTGKSPPVVELHLPCCAWAAQPNLAIQVAAPLSPTCWSGLVLFLPHPFFPGAC